MQATLFRAPVLRTSLLRAGTAAALAALLLGGPMALSGTANAQTEQTPQTAPQAPPMAVDDETLRSFAAATLEVESLNEEWSPRIAAATDPNEQQEVRTQAMEQMAEAVREQGLSVEEYNAMVQVVQADPEVADTVETYREELR